MENKDQKNEKLNNQEEVTPSTFKVIYREIIHDKLAMFSLFVALFIILFSLIGSFFLNQNQILKVDIMNSWLKPGQNGHLLGTDNSGYDLLGFLILGARNSILMGFALAIIIEVVGIFVGLISAYFGGVVDLIIMRIVDFFMILPFLMTIISIVSIWQHYTPLNLVLLMAAFSWMGTTRLMRSLALSQRDRDYVLASKTSGTSTFAIIFREILPNISTFIITDFTLTLASMIGFEVTLSYLGFGLPTSVPSLGTLIGYASDTNFMLTYPWGWLPALILLIVLTVSINFFGQALRRAADARQRTA
ncbi:ABC transporter permease [Xylocopilactobacillus apis]|uniref:Peptide ABC transporter permease n=1 Tax=Xylocopilactobacillus apis TaxID=2932183 RepID=A0AAU9DD73_9LACO|nr:ABC transporter permease [Xylocopilactobacillus apis]BDR56101.1 peptide ABC transporter permease [Xylocopilactobacillus apis]